MKTTLKIIATNAHTEHLQGETLSGELIVKDVEISRDVHVFTTGNKIYELDIKGFTVYEFGAVLLGVLIDLDDQRGGRICAQLIF